jgi:hypothetical protein
MPIRDSPAASSSARRASSEGQLTGAKTITTPGRAPPGIATGINPEGLLVVLAWSNASC